MDATTLAERPAMTGTPRTLRAKSSNNWLVLDGVDNRTALARRFRDLASSMLADLGIDERDLADSLKLQIRNAALLAVRVEQLQQRSFNGELTVDFELTRAQNALARQLWSLGLGKRRRTTGLGEHDLGDYLKAKAGAK